MSGVKISDLPAATTPLAGTELVPVVQGGVTTKATVSQVVSFTPSGTGAVTRTVQSKLQETVSVKDFGAVGDGAANDTAALQAALNAAAGKKLTFPSGTYKTSSLNVPSNTYIELSPGCVIQDAGTLGASERLLTISGVSNVVIYGYGATVQMTRATYTSGEQRHGVYLYGCADVTIYGLASNSCGGDGFYLGGGVGTPATRVRLYDVKATDNRRNNVSVVNAKDFYFSNFYLTNANGTAPQAGIDIEPNLSTDVLTGIIDGGVVQNNAAGYGVIVLLDTLTSASAPVDIQVNGLRSITNLGGLNLRNRNATPCTGRIVINNFSSTDDVNFGVFLLDYSKGIDTVISNPVIRNPNTSGGTNINERGGIVGYASSLAVAANGGIRIQNPQVFGNATGLNASVRPIAIRSSGAQVWQDVSVFYPELTGFSSTDPWSFDSNCESVRLYTELSEWTFNSAASVTMTDGRYFGRRLTNDGAGASIVYTLPVATTARIGWTYTFEVVAAQQLRVDPNGTDLIYGGTAGQYTVSSTKGDSVSVQVAAAGEWRVLNRVGSWSFV